MLEFKVKFEVPASCIYEAFVDEMKVRQFTRSPASVRPEPGADYSWLDGRISGKFLSLDKDKSIKMTWKMNDWTSFSEVELQFKDWEDSSELTVKQSKLPEKVDVRKIEAGWQQQIIQPMSQILGYPIDA